MKYTITAGDKSTDLGRVGQSDTLLGAKRIGRAAVREALPDQCGRFFPLSVAQHLSPWRFKRRDGTQLNLRKNNSAALKIARVLANGAILRN